MKLTNTTQDGFEILDWHDLKKVKDPAVISFDWNEDDEVLYLNNIPHRMPYAIEFSRLEKPMHLIEWLAHLLEKTWFSKWDARKMITCVSYHKNWNLHSRI